MKIPSAVIMYEFNERSASQKVRVIYCNNCFTVLALSQVNINSPRLFGTHSCSYFAHTPVA